MRRRTIANVATFGVVSLVFLVWVTSIVKIDRLNQPYRIKGDFASAVGLLPGSEVDYLGVTFGTVSRVARAPGGVMVTMKIDNGKKIPTGAIASIFRKSALGEQYVEVTPPAGYSGSGGPYIPKDAVIPRDHTTVPLEFSELLRSAARLISSIPPDDVHTLVHEAATGLAGNADALRNLADAGDRLSSMLAARTEVLGRLATNNTRLTHVVTEHAESLGQSLSDLRQLADSLKNVRGDTSVLLVHGAQLLGQLGDIVANHKGDLDCTLKDLELLTDVATTPGRLAGLKTVLEVGPVAFDGLWDASDVDPIPGYPNDPIGPVGRWIRVGLVQNSTNPPPEFVPPKSLPAVNAVPVCASPLRASMPSYSASVGAPGAFGAGGGSLPATGGAGLGFGAVFLLVGAALRAMHNRVRSPR